MPMVISAVNSLIGQLGTGETKNPKACQFPGALLQSDVSAVVHQHRLQ
jgi:hypothetical protein